MVAAAAPSQVARQIDRRACRFLAPLSPAAAIVATKFLAAGFRGCQLTSAPRDRKHAIAAHPRSQMRANESRSVQEKQLAKEECGSRGRVAGAAAARRREQTSLPRLPRVALPLPPLLPCVSKRSASVPPHSTPSVARMHTVSDNKFLSERTKIGGKHVKENWHFFLKHTVQMLSMLLLFLLLLLLFMILSRLERASEGTNELTNARTNKRTNVQLNGQSKFVVCIMIFHCNRIASNQAAAAETPVAIISF